MFLYCCPCSFFLPQQQQAGAQQDAITNLEARQQPASLQNKTSTVNHTAQQQQQQQQHEQEQEHQEQYLRARRISDTVGHSPASADSMLQQKYKFIKHLGGGAFGAVVQASVVVVTFSNCSAGKWCYIDILI
jgi:hypothetical protein